MIASIGLKNLGTVNKNRVEITYKDKRGNDQHVEIYFSYETIVGIEGYGYRFISQNDWSVTTAKLLNELEPNKNARYPHARVMKEVNRVLAEACK